MSERNDAAPHECPECASPSYIGFGTQARCVSRECLFYCSQLWAEWVMLLPDDGMPKDSEPDFFDLEEEDTNPGFFVHPSFNAQGTLTGRLPATKTWGNYLDTYGAVLGKTRKPGESDDDFYDRLLATWSQP